MRGKPPYAWEPEKGAYVGVMKRGGSTKDIRLVSRRGLLRLPRHERLGGRRPHHRRRDAVRGSAAVHPSRRLADRSGKVARPAVPLDLRPRRQHRPLHAHLSRRHHRRIPAHRRSPRRPGQSARLVRLRQPGLADARRAVGHRACRRRGPRAAATICCRPATPSPSRCSSPRSPDAAEGDGWLLAVVWRARENRSDLAVFNATDVASGPIALVQLGHRVPDGFHGNWVEAI